MHPTNSVCSDQLLDKDQLSSFLDDIGFNLIEDEAEDIVGLDDSYTDCNSISTETTPQSDCQASLVSQPTLNASFTSQTASDQHNQCLVRLVESMKRSEESRQFVIRQRNALSQEQQQALSMARELLKKQNENAVKCSTSQAFK